MLLGPHGSAESTQEYSRVLAEWEANGRRELLPGAGPILDRSVEEFIDQFWLHFGQHYRDAEDNPTCRATGSETVHAGRVMANVERGTHLD